MNKEKYFKPSLFKKNYNISEVDRVYLDILYTRDRMIGIFEYHGDVKLLGIPQKEAYMERVNKIKMN